jgi:hypothetical protein
MLANPSKNKGTNLILEAGSLFLQEYPFNFPFVEYADHKFFLSMST